MGIDPLIKFNLDAVKAAFEIIKKIELHAVSQDEIKELLIPILCGYRVHAPRINPGLNLYSGCLGPKPLDISDIDYPPADTAPNRPAKRAGQSIFYCTTSRESAIFELQPKAGDTVAIAHWVTTTPLILNHVGYTRSVFEKLGSKREPPSWGSEESIPAENGFEEVANFLSDLFMKDVPAGDEQLYYKLTSAVAEKLISDGPINGLLYPSMKMHGNADVVALKPEFASKNFRFLKAEFIKINALNKAGYDIKVLDTAPEIGQNGTIEWYTASASSKASLARRYGTIGWQEFLRQKKDILSDYDSAKESHLNRPMLTEHGNVGEASFRKWLSQYLPKKYGITSGFIIPDVRSMNYVIRHYDVIVFDVLNSPVLWGSNNPDKSEQGRTRAIPAKYVHGVFEVKATLNKGSIEKAIAKLQELSEFRSHLPDHFVSGAVFFELREKNQASCKLAEGLFCNDVPGYFGGLILRAESYDPNLTCYYRFHSGGPETIEDMPFVREIGDLKRDDEGRIQLTEQGDTATAYASDGVWHFDKGYSPIVKNVQLCWAYNSFPMFFLELLERLQGVYDPGKPSEQGAYGLSFMR